MMQLSDIFARAADHDRGAWLELRDPLTGELTGIRLHMVGPDSAAQGRARLALVDELAELADDAGRVTARDRERARLNQLARLVIGWEVHEDGQPVPFTHANVVRVLKAAPWVQAQADAFAADRRNFEGVSHAEA